MKSDTAFVIWFQKVKLVTANSESYQFNDMFKGHRIHLFYIEV